MLQLWIDGTHHQKGQRQGKGKYEGQRVHQGQKELTRTMLDMLWDRTQVVGMSMESRWPDEDANSRKSGGQPESEEDGEVGSVWVVGNVKELEEEKKGPGGPGWTLEELGT